MSEVHPLVAVVDDDLSVRRALVRLLRSAGYQVEAFPSADAFLAQLDTCRAACLILDVRMPGTSGLDVPERLQASDHAMPVVFITGHGDRAMARRAMATGAVRFLTKPFDDEELLRAVSEGVRLSGKVAPVD